MANGLVTRVVASAPSPDAEQAKEASEGFDAGQLIPAGIILGAAIVIAIAVRFGVERFLRGRNEIIARLVARTILFVIVAIGLVYALSTVGIRVGLLLGGLGIGGFAIAFALKDSLENLIAGVILQIRQPFDYDDLVEIGEFEGSVDDIDLRSVEMTLFSGERVTLPSAHVLQNPITNFTTNGTRRVDITVGVSYDADVTEACDLLTAAMRDVDGVLDEPAPATTFDGFGASSIDLTARFWIRSDASYFDIQRAVATALKRALDDHGVEIPFPHRQLIDGAANAGAAGERQSSNTEQGEARAPEAVEDASHSDDDELAEAGV
ncbi:MAG: mechanosensitive ion channel family protein [Ilumatobacter sp.]|nr:mechanosensitive ion channel family protein [Ilumatobacter sp.]